MRGRPHLIPALIVAEMLLFAATPLPYVYYQVLRWLTCGVGVFVAFEAYRCRKIWAVCIFGLIAILFNPIVPIHLSKEQWWLPDFVCALLFATSMFVIREPAK